MKGWRRLILVLPAVACAATTGEVGRLAAEVRGQGRIAFSAVSPAGDWDLFVMRPDGSDRRKLTDTREFNEAGVRFSPDGRSILYYRIPAAEAVDNNSYGTYELVIARADGSQPEVLGRDFPWASWGPDSKNVAVLTPAGIEIVDLATRAKVRTLPRQGLVQQLAWAPDGSAFVGTANGLGPFWNIGRLGADGSRVRPVSETSRYNCTPDWMPDARHVLYARGIVPNEGGRAELWIAAAEGGDRRMLYAEADRHIYGACASPDGRYLLFTRSVEDLGKVDHKRTTMAIVRLADTPMRAGADALRLDLGPGWEPHWTGAGGP